MITPDQSLHATFGLTLKALALSLMVLWTIAANTLVFVVLYKNPRLQTVPNLLVANLAFSDLCLGLIVLPLSSVYACTGEWVFPDGLCQIFVSADILCSTASIWNLGVVGLDSMILAVWLSSAFISLAPLLGWKQRYNAEQISYRQCTFLDLPSYTIYSATGSFFIPTIVMFFVYYKIYQAFAKHRARQIYRQKVIRKHIESTILHEISHVLPTSDEFAKELDEEDDDDEGVDDEDDEGCGVETPLASAVENEKKNCSFAENLMVKTNGLVTEKQKPLVAKKDFEPPESVSQLQSQRSFCHQQLPPLRQTSLYAIQSKGSRILASISSKAESQQSFAFKPTAVPHLPAFRIAKTPFSNEADFGELKQQSITWSPDNNKERLVKTKSSDENATNHNHQQQQRSTQKKAAATAPPRAKRSCSSAAIITYEKVKRHKERCRKERVYRKSLQKKPRAISAAKERRGVKVLGIILGCFTVCWTPFFVMYVVVQFCSSCSVNPHIEMFITWLGYSNSAMNPIIYTVFNRDYQIALKKLFYGTQNRKLSTAGIMRPVAGR